jgi:hypothetical protein
MSYLFSKYNFSHFVKIGNMKNMKKILKCVFERYMYNSLKSRYNIISIEPKTFRCQAANFSLACQDDMLLTSRC